jgi:hypothetical protein
MHFEQRELKPHAEPVSASELKEGSVYFSVQFIDSEMLIPVIEPLVFIGRNLMPGDVVKLYFQDADSYGRGLPHSDSRASLYGQEETELNHIFEYERALDVLIRCSVRRRKGLGAENA